MLDFKIGGLKLQFFENRGTKSAFKPINKNESTKINV
jgi:hypothetical protein